LDLRRRKWRRLHNEEHRNLSSNIIRVIKLKMMKCAGRIARMGKWSENLKGRDHLEDLTIDGRVRV
jgi:hypothetical protein